MPLIMDIIYIGDSVTLINCEAYRQGETEKEKLEKWECEDGELY
jgi:hypothetical protein